MKELLRNRIKEMTALIGVSGQEWNVARYIKKALTGYVDSIEVRPNGILIARKKGNKSGPKVLITAHMDEVGYIVKSISPKGFLFFDKVGGATEGCLPGRRVWVKGEKGAIPGIIGVRAGHLLTAEQMAKPQTVGQSYVDICVDSKEEAQALGIGPGAQIVPDSPCTEMLNSDYMVTRAADCRVLCAVIIETIKKLAADDINGEIYAVFNILEESTIAASAVAVNYLDPEYGLFLDTIPCGDVPDCDFLKELPVALKEGPVILIQQQWASGLRNAGSHPKLIEALRKAGKTTGVKHQEVSFCGAGYITDAVGAVIAGNGPAVATLACPRRYSHSPVELIHMYDVEALQKIVEEFLKNPVDLNMMD
ncbi:MAG: M42 family peptidase [Synergistaceae bacterium]